MTDEAWRGAPAFGRPPPAVRGVVRESAYGLVEGERGRLAVVRTPRGAYLPGGGVEAGETPEEAVAREAREECGLVVRVGVRTERAIQFVYSEPEQTHFEKRSVYVEAVVVGVETDGVEDDHDLVWVEPAEAARLLTHESQRWAVGRWLSARGSGESPAEKVC